MTYARFSLGRWTPFLRVHGPWILVALGVLARLAWLANTHFARTFVGEADNVARTFARTGVLADAFHPGQGPTAHLMPIPTLIAGWTYRLFGWETATAETILCIWSLILVFASFLWLYKAFEELETPLAGRLAGLAILCLAPLNFALETLWFRVWDGGLAVALAALMLYRIVVLDRQPVIRTYDVVLTALLLAMLFFVNPPFGLAGYLCALILMLNRLPPRRWPAAAAIAAAMLLAVLTPWTLRNIEVMHAPILLRDNLGLELALANYDGAVDAPDHQAELRRRWLEIHPYASMSAFARMQAAGGEVAYSKALQAETIAWIGTHPAGFATLTLRHIRELLFPPAWHWSMFLDRPGTGTGMKMAFHTLISIFGLAGIAFGLAMGVRRYSYVAIVALVPLVPYFFLQPTLRYRYLSVALLLYIGTALVARLIAWAGRPKPPLVGLIEALAIPVEVFVPVIGPIPTKIIV